MAESKIFIPFKLRPKSEAPSSKTIFYPYYFLSNHYFLLEPESKACSFTLFLMLKRATGAYFYSLFGRLLGDFQIFPHIISQHMHEDVCSKSPEFLQVSKNKPHVLLPVRSW